MGVLKETLEALRQPKEVEAARTMIKFHGDIANSILSDAVSLANDLPEDSKSAGAAIIFVLKRVAPKTAASLRNFSIWVKEQHVASQQEPPEAVPAEEFVNIREVAEVTVKTPQVRLRKADRALY